MTHLPRPQAPAPNIAAIPAELQARAQWVVWRYELDKRGKWTKVPYTAGTTRKAASTRPSTYRSFDKAVACYQERPDFFDGIGYVFRADDPYVGGDFDHCLSDGTLSDFARQHLPATYAEISPSGSGVKFIVRASVAAGRKTALAEVYGSRRFFTFTGNILPGQPAMIAEGQEAIDRLLAALPCSAKAVRDGSAGSGSRADLVKDIPDSEWDAGRQLVRTQIHRLLARVRAAAKEETQLAYLLRGDYAGFHQKWAFVGLYRADGSLDESQVRAVAANGIRGRGFTFPEYAALMTHLYGAAAVAKWGTKQAWREELAALWFKSSAPRHAPKPPKVERAPRGRAGNHAALVEKVYQILLEHRAGAQAIVQIADIAAAIGAHRRTVSTILNELRGKDRISTKRLGQYGGLVITFSDVIYSDAPEAARPALAPQIETPAPALEETRELESCVSSDRAEADHISPAEEPKNSEESAPPTLRDLAAHYLSMPATAIGRRHVNETTGAVVYRRTAQHFAELVVADYGAHYTYDAAIEAYHAEQAHREELARQEWQRFFKRLKAMTNEELIAYVGGRLRAEVAELAREGAVFDKHLYRTRLECAKKHLGWRGLEMPARKTTLKPAPAKRPALAPEPEPTAVDPIGAINRLKRLRDQRTAQQVML